MKRALIGWCVIGVVALVWELLGVFGVFGLWPLTWEVRDALDASPDVASLVLILAIVGFPAWLVYHFLVMPRRYGRDG